MSAEQFRCQTGSPLELWVEIGDILAAHCPQVWKSLTQSWCKGRASRSQSPPKLSVSKHERSHGIEVLMDGDLCGVMARTLSWAVQFSL
eukprot:3652125-Amphidinium_carterae.1